MRGGCSSETFTLRPKVVHRFKARELKRTQVQLLHQCVSDLCSDDGRSEKGAYHIRGAVDGPLVDQVKAH